MSRIAKAVVAAGLVVVAGCSTEEPTPRRKKLPPAPRPVAATSAPIPVAEEPTPREPEFIAHNVESLAIIDEPGKFAVVQHVTIAANPKTRRLKQLLKHLYEAAEETEGRHFFKRPREISIYIHAKHQYKTPSDDSWLAMVSYNKNDGDDAEKYSLSKARLSSARKHWKHEFDEQRRIQEEQDRLAEIAEEEAMNAAEEARQDRLRAEADEKRRLDRKRQIESAFHFWDGAHMGLEAYIKKNMNDPDSFEHVQTSYFDRGNHIVVNMTFRGKNAFNATITQQVSAEADLDGNILEIISGSP